ncbi:calcium-binding protein [Pleurocapsales cyanobacterium LEGE 10410]|nr:calcium-binding protein [Pleurocapsales cyanobacterium LEGE 10410]
MLNSNENTEVLIFGDSLSDSGNSFALTLGAIPPEPPYVSGRFSNGLVAVEYLAKNLGFAVNPYYDDGIGNNFAVGGAKTGTGNSNNDDIAPFLPGVTLPGVSKQIDDYEATLEDGRADSDALYFVWAGPNDFLDYLGGSVPADPAVLIEDGISNNVNNVTRLADLGAKNIVVPNMPSLGRLPFSVEFQNEATAISIAYNGGLSLALDNLDLVRDSSETQVMEVDLFTANETIAANPEQFGLSNISDPLLLSGLDPVETTGFFFWDIFHPTTQAHALFADTIEQTIAGEIPQPTFNDIVGTDSSEFIFGTQGEDNIDGLADDDVILGLDGDDRLEGWKGTDLIFGNQGHDIIDGGEDRDYLWGGVGNDLLFGSQGEDRLLGNQGKDILIGGEDRDYLRGGVGDDYLLGGEGEDSLWGGQGNDTLNGGGGNDLIRGNQGDDLIDGGTGDDTLSGNAGADVFELTPDFGTDQIVDFQQGSDRLMLSGDLTFGDLFFTNDRISVTATDETLAILSGVDTTDLTEIDFV